MKKRILVLDAYPQLRSLLVDELTDEGYEVISSSELGELKRLLPKTAPDLLVMEIGPEHPEASNPLSEIKAANAELPIVVWTAYTMNRWDGRARAAEYIIPKSSDTGSLKLAIAAVLEDRRRPGMARGPRGPARDTRHLSGHS